MNSAAPSESGPRGGFAAFRHRDFTFYWFAQLCQLVPMQMMAVVIGWQVYQITGNPLDLGLIGLAEFLPVPLLVLLAGHASDRFDRRRVIQISDGARALMALALLKVTFDGATDVWPFYLLALGMGVTRAFGAPAGQRCRRTWCRSTSWPMPSPGAPPASRCRLWWVRCWVGSFTRCRRSRSTPWRRSCWRARSS